MKMNDHAHVSACGSLALDLALGIGGSQRGRIVDISGGSSEQRICRVIAEGRGAAAITW